MVLVDTEVGLNARQFLAVIVSRTIVLVNVLKVKISGMDKREVY